MNDFFHYEIHKQRHEELLKEAEKERMIKEYKKSLKPFKHNKTGHQFLNGVYRLFFHKKKDHIRSYIHKSHSVQV